MSRAVWFVAGAAAGVYGAVRARRAAESLTPDGLRDRAAGLSLGARLFADEVRAGAVEKETELRHRLELVHDGPRELDGSRSTDGPGAADDVVPTGSTNAQSSTTERPISRTHQEEQ